MVQRVDRLSRVLEQEADPDTSHLFSRAMGQPCQSGTSPRKLERQATDAIVGKSVSQNDRHLRGGIHLFRSQSGADACVTSSKNQEPVQVTVLSVSSCKNASMRGNVVAHLA